MSLMEGTADTIVPIVIVGSGIGGVVTALRLREAGFDPLVLERASDVGGTWYANTYPGCAVDTSILNYSLSTDPDPGWSRLYAPQSEILEYIRGLVQKSGLRERIRFDANVTQMQYDEHNQCWVLSLADGKTLQARVVVGATGVLSEPRLPAIEGIDRFQGQLIHSGAWPDVSLAGKTVAVVGTGCSAAQIVPEMAVEAKALLVFQRSAPWVFPRDDRAIEGWRAFMLRRVPFVRRFRRYVRFWQNDLVSHRFEHRSPWIAKHQADAMAFIRKSVRDPQLRELVTPDYLPGCKRRVMSDDWYPALQRDNVQLVPLAVTALDETRVRDAGGVWHDADVVVFATGFTATNFARFPIIGKDGVSLAKHWAAGARTYLGLTVSGFPNYFIVGGPSIASGAGSYFFTAECQARYITSAISRMERRGVGALELKSSVESAAYEEVQRRLSGSVYGSGGCQAWYQSDDGRIDTLWPGTMAEYWWRTRRYRPSDFDEFASPAPVGATWREAQVANTPGQH